MVELLDCIVDRVEVVTADVEAAGMPNGRNPPNAFSGGMPNSAVSEMKAFPMVASNQSAIQTLPLH